MNRAASSLVVVAGAAALTVASLADARTPLPPPRPESAPAVPAPPVPAEPAPAPLPPQPTLKQTTGDACRARLAHLGARFHALPAVSEGACGMADAVELAGVGDRVALEPPARLDCASAEAVVRWLTEAVPPALGPGGGPIQVAVAESYGCRSRNRIAGAQISEHGLGNAIDIAAVTRGALSVPIAAGEGEATGVGEARDRLRRSACDYFTTVLGPGSDAAHADHLHLDVKSRDGGYRICE